MAVEIYGPKGNYNQLAWENRYQDCMRSQRSGNKSLACILDREGVDVDKLLHLPCPFNMGDEWYTAAFEIIEKSLGVLDKI